MREINPALASLAEHPDAPGFPRLVEVGGHTDCYLLQARGYKFPRAMMQVTADGRIDILMVRAAT